MLRISDEQSVEREGIFPGNFVKQVVSLRKTVDFRVKRDELRREEVIGSDRRENDARVELLGLARKVAVGEVLDEVTVRAIVDTGIGRL